MTEQRTGLDDGPKLPTRPRNPPRPPAPMLPGSPRNPSRPPAHTFTHTYAILEISFEAWREVRLCLEDAGVADVAGRAGRQMEGFNREYLGQDDDGRELIIFGPVALKAKKSIVTRGELLEQRSKQFDVLMRDVRTLIDKLGPPALPSIRELDRVGVEGRFSKCASNCGHIFAIGDRIFEGDRCQECAKVELTARFTLQHAEAMNEAELTSGAQSWPRR